MVRIPNGLFGPIIGSLGDKVYSCINGRQYVRSRPGKRRGDPTPAQAAHYLKFALASRFTRCMRPLINETYKDKTGKVSASNAFMSHILRDAITGEYPNFTIDYRKVILSIGNVFLDDVYVYDKCYGTLPFIWDYDRNQPLPSRRDTIVMIAYSEEKGECKYRISSMRSSEHSRLRVDEFSGDHVHVWIAFQKEDKTEFSYSRYLGMVKVV